MRLDGSFWDSSFHYVVSTPSFSGCFGFALDITSMGNMCSGVLSWMTVWFAIGRILV